MPHRTTVTHTKATPPCSHLARAVLSQDPVHKWADLQRALLPEGQSVWCCKGCIGIINEDKDATYEEIRVKVEAAAAARLEPLPEITGLGDSQVARATDLSSIASTDAGGTDDGGTVSGGKADASRTANDSLEASTANAAAVTVSAGSGVTASAGAAGAAAAVDHEPDTNEQRLERVETGIFEIQEALANTKRAAVVCAPVCGIL